MYSPSATKVFLQPQSRVKLNRAFFMNILIFRDGVRSNAVTLILLSLCWAFGIAAFQFQDDILQQVFAVSALILVRNFYYYLATSQPIELKLSQVCC